MKIKDSNDLLGYLIKNMDGNRDVKSQYLLDNSGIDPVSLQSLLYELRDKRYIIYSMDTQSVTSLGINNYVSPAMKVLRFLAIATKEIAVFSAGVISGIVAMYLFEKCLH